jgi:hypothetical protein
MREAQKSLRAFESATKGNFETSAAKFRYRSIRRDVVSHRLATEKQQRNDGEARRTIEKFALQV